MVRLYNAYIRIFGKLIHRNDTTEIKVVEDILRYRSKRRGKKQNITNFYRKFQIKSELFIRIDPPTETDCRSSPRIRFVEIKR